MVKMLLPAPRSSQVLHSHALVPAAGSPSVTSSAQATLAASGHCDGANDSILFHRDSRVCPRARPRPQSGPRSSRRQCRGRRRGRSPANPPVRPRRGPAGPRSRAAWTSACSWAGALAPRPPCAWRTAEAPAAPPAPPICEPPLRLLPQGLRACDRLTDRAVCPALEPDPTCTCAVGHKTEKERGFAQACEQRAAMMRGCAAVESHPCDEPYPIPKPLC